MLNNDRLYLDLLTCVYDNKNWTNMKKMFILKQWIWSMREVKGIAFLSNVYTYFCIFLHYERVLTFLHYIAYRNTLIKFVLAFS